MCKDSIIASMSPDANVGIVESENKKNGYSKDGIPLVDRSAEVGRLPEDIQNMFTEITAANPIGTKFLIELEIVETEGKNNTMDCMFAKNKVEEFQDLTGCIITKIFMKEVKVVEESTSLRTIAESLLNKVNELNSMGIN